MLRFGNYPNGSRIMMWDSMSPDIWKVLEWHRKQLFLIRKQRLLYLFSRHSRRFSWAERKFRYSLLDDRTIAFSAQDDFLTYMNNTKDPGMQIENVKFLKRELEGENRWFISPMKIDHRNLELSIAGNDSAFKTELENYMTELDDKIKSMEADKDSGRAVNAFPPVRAGLQETIPGSALNSGSAGPNLGKLARHQMKNVLDPMEKAVTDDKKLLTDFLTCCG